MANGADLVVKAAVKINAKSDKVWEALTNPAIIKQYLFGTDTISDWKEGSRITFKGVWDGKEYIDGGTILKIEPAKVLQYTYWSSMSGTEDIPENYAIITFVLSEEGGETFLTLTNDNCKTEKMRDHLTENWTAVLNSMKKVVEN